MSDAVTTAYGVAEYGRAVAGGVSVDTNGPLPGETSRIRPFVWTPENGSRELPVPAGTRNAKPNNISADGSTLLGWYDFNNSGTTRFGARWVNGEFIPFTTPAMYVGEANASTPNGSVIIGRNAGPRLEAWYWTQENGVQLLGRLGAINVSSANSISDDGQVISGFGGSVAQFPGDVAGHREFLWTPELGFVNFDNFLRAQGTAFDGWLINSTNSMTPTARHSLVPVTPRTSKDWLDGSSTYRRSTSATLLREIRGTRNQSQSRSEATWATTSSTATRLGSALSKKPDAAKSLQHP
jgi:uncharacterized membrane protein